MANFCKLCGAKLPDNASVCPYCGNTVTPVGADNEADSELNALMYTNRKKTCRTIACIVLAVSAALIILSSGYLLICGVNAFATFDDMLLILEDMYDPETIATIESAGITIADMLTVVAAIFVAAGLSGIALAVVNIVTAFLSLKIGSKKAMRPIAVVSIVLNVLLGGFPIGVVPGILLLCAPKSEYKA